MRARSAHQLVQLVLDCAHSSASGNAGFISMIGFQTFASSALRAVKAS
jgi:hypothetical protein